VLEAHAAYPSTELALKLGVDDSYVGKLRRGWVPTRVREDLWNRLQALDPGQGPTGTTAVRERAPTFGDESRDYYRGMQDATLHMMRAVVSLQTQIGEALRPPAPPASPTAAARSQPDED